MCALKGHIPPLGGAKYKTLKTSVRVPGPAECRGWIPQVCVRERESLCACVRACVRARALPGLLVRIQLVFGGHCSLYANQPSAPQEPSVLLRGQCRALRPRKHQRLSGKLLSNKPVIDLKIEEEEGGRISLEFLLDEERTLCGSLEVRCGKYAMWAVPVC